MDSRLLSKCLIFLFSILYHSSILAISEVNPQSSSTEQIESGKKSFNQGHYEEAIIAWNVALANFKSADDNDGQARVLHYKAEAYLATGQNHKAISSLHQAAQLAASNGNDNLSNQIASTLGTAYMLSNRQQEAQELFENTIKQQQENGSFNLAAVAGNNLGNLLASTGNYDKAIAIYQRAIADAESAGDNQLQTKGMVNIARAMVADQRSEQALNQLQLATKQAETLPSSHDKAYILISIGQLYSKLSAAKEVSTGKTENLAVKALKAAAAIARKSVDQRALSYTHGYLGELSEKSGQIKDAMHYSRQASDFLRGLDAPDILYRWQWLEGRLLQKQGNIDQAINAYQRAVTNLQKVRHVLAASSMNSNSDFRSNAGRLYMDLADLLLKNSEQLVDKKELDAELRQVRATVEMLKTAELEDYFKDDCVAALQKKTRGIDQVGEQTAALYPIIFDDRLEILLSLPDGMKRYTVSVSEKDLGKEINRFRALLEKRTTHQYKRPARNIYNWLIKPLENDLQAQNIDTLIMIPDGQLRTIPLTALYDGKQFLVSKYAVATTPGLTLTDPQPLPRNNLKLLIAGLTEGVQGFSPLPDVDSEIKRLDELYEASIFKNNSFTQANIENELGDEPYSIVHVASHGKFKSDVRNTFLLTYDGKINMDMLESYMASTTYRKKPVELLTLSACQTAVGDNKAALGLGGIAVKAGARSALATLWYINDQASSMLIKQFYTELKNPDISKAKALQLAQMSLVNDPRFKHPSYWAPFLLIGNWL